MKSMYLLLTLSIVAIALTASDNAALARGHRYHSYSHYGGYHYRRYHRSLEAKHQFWNITGHPHGWPGHVVDHITPLACGGDDSPSNMQWQTIADAKAKDKIERRTCHHHLSP